MKLWLGYISRIKLNCADSPNGKDLPYWRNNLFAGTIIYLLPFCLIALLPGLYWVYITHIYILAILDLVAIAGLVIVGFIPGIKQAVRKIIFISVMYAFSCAQLYLLKLAGPGLIYLLASCTLSILILPNAFRYWPVLLNALICFLFAAGIFANIIPRLNDRYHAIGEWLAVSANLVFLSFLLAALIPRLFNGLQETIDNEKRLKEELSTQQKSLTQKNNELEQFAYVASHDLKEPVRMVTSFMVLLKSKYGNQLDEKAHNYMNFAIDGGVRMQKMINDLLELSRTARTDMEKEWVNLDEMWNEAKQNILRLIEDTGAEINVQTRVSALCVYRTDFIRLLQNLLTNAIKFRKKETVPNASLNVIEKKKEWLFSIEDNGIGIEKDKFEKIFEIFSRLHSRENYDGTGIGLAVCKKIVEHHGGKIWVESAEGKGTTIFFTIQK